jgi:alkyl hydroperoxide reductase subunit AhpC
MKQFFFILVIFILCTSFFSDNTPVKSVINKPIADFTLKNTHLKNVSLANYKNAKGFIIIFISNHCPFAKLYTERINALHQKYILKGVPTIAINSIDTVVYEDETLAEMKKVALSKKLKFPYIKDAKQLVGKNFNAINTPEAFIIWKENNQWIIKYSGAIDNNGEHPENATPYLSNALNELLLNKKVSLPETRSFGCKIYYN